MEKINILFALLVLAAVIGIVVIGDYDFSATGKAVADKNGTLAVKTYIGDMEVSSNLTVIAFPKTYNSTKIVWTGKSPASISLSPGRYGVKAHYNISYSTYENRNVTVTAKNTTLVNITHIKKKIVLDTD